MTTPSTSLQGALALCLSALAASAGCTGTRAGADAAAPAGRPAVAVEVTAVATADLADDVEVVGSLAPKFEADVKSEYSGIVTEVYVTEWVRVRKGTPLARLDSREVTTALEASRASLLQAQVNATRATRELERAGSLQQYGLVTAQQLDDARSAREAAEAATAAARAQVSAVETRLTKTLITAPLEGVVAYRGVSVGDRVENMGSSEPMFRIVDTDRLEVTMQVPTAALAVVKVGQPIEFHVDAVPGRTFTGAVSHINPTVDPVSRAARVEADVPNGDGLLRSGLFVKGRIVTGRRAQVVQVPRASLLNWNVDQRSADVFVLSGETVARRRITTGRDDGAAIEVTSGVTAGDRVVSRGAFNLRDGDRVRVTALPRAGA